MNNILVFKPEELFSVRMMEVLGNKVDHFYSESNFIKTVRSYLNEIKDKYSFYITSTIEVKEDSTCETYFFHNRLDDKPFMSFVLNGHSALAIHKRIVSTPKSINYFNSFIESVKKNTLTDLFLPVIPLFVLAFTNGGQNFLLDSCDDDHGQYLILEAIKSKFTAEFFLFI